MLELNINLIVHREKKHEKEKFKDVTSKTTMFTNCFKSNYENIDFKFNRWKRCFKKALYSCFRKIRVKNDLTEKQSKMDILMEEKKSLLKKKNISVEEKQRVKNIEEEITQEFEDKEYEKLIKTLGHLESEGDQTDNINIWK